MSAGGSSPCPSFISSKPGVGAGWAWHPTPSEASRTRRTVARLAPNCLGRLWLDFLTRDQPTLETLRVERRVMLLTCGLLLIVQGHPHRLAGLVGGDRLIQQPESRGQRRVVSHHRRLVVRIVVASIASPWAHRVPPFGPLHVGRRYTAPVALSTQSIRPAIPMPVSSRLGLADAQPATTSQNTTPATASLTGTASPAPAYGRSLAVSPRPCRSGCAGPCGLGQARRP